MPGRALVIHGGTGYGPSKSVLSQARRRLRRIAQISFAFLASHSSLETVAEAVRLLEDDAFFNAGTGSFLQRDGRACMSASIMDGHSGRFGSVLNIERVRNPVLVARKLLGERDRILAADGARRYARRHGFGDWNPVTAERLKRWKLLKEEEHGTVGAAAVDDQGRLAVATSTGGKGFELPGRVSDSGLPVGNYASSFAAASCTGIGEDIVEEALAVRLVERAGAARSVHKAFQKLIPEIKARQRRAGAVGLDLNGRISWGTTMPILIAVGITGRGLKESF